MVAITIDVHLLILKHKGKGEDGSVFLVCGDNKLTVCHMCCQLNPPNFSVAK